MPETTKYGHFQAATFHAPLPLLARDLIPGRTPGTLSNSIGVNGHDSL